MTAIDYDARLTLIQAAITAILEGKVQSYDYEGLSVTRLDLDWLSREEERLIAKLNRRNRGGVFRTAVPR
ncbi:hypothetical protein SAMN06265173_14815 [Thalassovita litoralis]|jgi:hypothetical protein|uniref:Uncharacterized protein n=1 Tax=Thalassovita litoralis TaxID=1010611 RepID=A0A521FTR8_9RHOB|nr:hypothetical protein [Thalassovita litoralis]SMO98960.1 hypothetical protein SAMN06265173_14815 [Thalassovita litoralis]